MTTQEKIQLVLDVINGKLPPADLKPILDEPSDINVFKAAVDHCVGKVLKDRNEGGAQFRFKITEHAQDIFTGWEPETSQLSAGWAMNQLRLERPQAAISIERRYV
jgi:hypothetical protein